MKYDSSMTQFHDDIVSAIKAMISPGKEAAKELVCNASPVPMREFVKKYGKTYFHGENFECIPNALFVCFDHTINDNGDTKLQLSWSQVAKFIRDNASEIFDNPEDEEPSEESRAGEETSSPGIEVLDLDLRTYNALKRAGVNTIADAEAQMEQLENIIPKKIDAVRDGIAKYKGIPIPGTWVEEDMLGDELTFDDIANMVGDIIIMDCSTESHAWYKAVRVEKIVTKEDGTRRLIYFDGTKQRGMVDEIYFDKSQRRPDRAWRIKHQSDFPCDNCGYDGNGCCDYPDTPDDYCICGDKQIPKDEKTPSHSTSEEISAPAQTETSMPAVFDYSALDTDTAHSLKECETVIKTETAGYFTILGAKFKEAQDLLANHSSGTFEQWYTSMGFRRQTVYNLIQRYEFSSSPTIGGREEAFEALPLTLSYEISKPAAPAELVEKVLDGDITTNAEYQKLKAELEEAVEKKEFWIKTNSETNKENQQLRADRNIALSRADNAERKLSEAEAKIKELNEERERNAELEDRDDILQRKNDVLVLKNQELEQRVKELENRPVEVAVQSDEEAIAEKDQEIYELKEEIERLSDKDVKVFAIKLTFDEFDKLLQIVSGGNDARIVKAIKKAQLIRL